MNSPGDWVSILYTYGPFAILVFLVFITPRQIHKGLKGTSEGVKKTLPAIYVVNWLLIFGLVIFCVYAWKRLHLDRPPTIEGRIDNLSNSETLVTGSAVLYVHRIRVTNRNSAYDLMLVDPKVGEKLVFTIDPSDCTGNEGGITDFELPIQQDFFVNGLRLRREHDKLFWSRNGQDVELPGRKESLAAPATDARLEPMQGFFTAVAYAQTTQSSFSADDFAIGLESPNALIRRNARADLAKQGQAALPWIEAVLDDPKGYRIKLGVIVALNNMQDLRVEALKPSTIARIQNAALDPDEALKNEAINFLNKYHIAFPVTVYEDVDFHGKSQGFGPGKYRADKRQLGSLPNDSASSLRVAKGYRIRLCESEGDGNGKGKCREYAEGNHPMIFGIPDETSYIEVTKK